MANETTSKDAPQPVDASGKLLSGIYSILIPPLPRAWAEARRMVADSKIRMADVATTVCLDVALGIELLRTSNSMFFSAGRPPVSTCLLYTSPSPRD